MGGKDPEKNCNSRATFFSVDVVAAKVLMHASCFMLLLTATALRHGGALRNLTKAMSSLSFHELDSVESTQDEARQLLPQTLTPYLAVSAKQQVKGRGTSGRVWKGLSGNVFLTVALPFDQIPVSITLLPLQVGILIAETLQQVLQEICEQKDNKLTLKWPNDVLINHKKVAGVLIESHIHQQKTVLLVGVGINILEKPEISAEEGRPAASIQEYCSKTLPDTTSHVISRELANRLVEWMQNSEDDIVETWKTWAEFNTPQKLRDTGELVVPLSIERDGQLRVRQENGEERLLMADYLY
jgi:BirA family biotin operon repressor/biotin-[acetyl-CoA-carboxylase] ligase